MRFVLNICVWIIRWLPKGVLARTAYAFLRIVKYRKSVVYKNIDHVDLLVEKDEFYKRYLRYVSRLITEILKFNPNKNASAVFLEKGNTFEKIHEAPRSIILASHYSNWELICTVLPTHIDIPVYGIYKPLKNKIFDNWIKERRGALSLNLVAVNELPRLMIEHQKSDKKAIYILISDQNPKSKNNAIWTNFLGVKTPFFNGPEKLSTKFDLPVFYMRVDARENYFEYSVAFEKVDADAVIQSYAHLLGKQISENPRYWLWSHKRWKRSVEY